MWWMNIIVVALLALGIFGFVSLVRLLTRRMTSETTRRTEDMYDQYADSPHKRHRRSLASRRYCPVLPNRVPNSPLRFAARSWGLATLRAEGGHLEGNGSAFPAPLLRHAASTVVQASSGYSWLSATPHPPSPSIRTWGSDRTPTGRLGRSLIQLSAMCPGCALLGHSKEECAARRLGCSLFHL
jgi:hypothetical protein